MQDRTFITYFALHAANAIEKANVSRDMVLRMIEMIELRDPYETKQHAKRVGEYALNLYDRYAASKGVPEAERNLKKDMFRTASMLHDIGKVGVNENLMAKPGSLEADEQEDVYRHTIYGARLFRNYKSAWEKVAYEVVLNHHERWDGSGYPGDIDDIMADDITFGAGKRGNEIPLSARIVSICDIYDTLISERSYKEAWSEDSAISFIRNKSGKFFDPELVEHFMNMAPILKAIKERLP